MYLLKNYLLFTFFCCCKFSTAQNYQAINGSAYGGSLSGNNPAAIVHVPYAWDITPIAFQFKQSTNAFSIEQYSLLSTPDSSYLNARNGTSKKFALGNQDIRLLNTRINLNSKAAIAFGANIRNYIYGTTSNINWQDTIFTLADFMKINLTNQPLSGEAGASGWVEMYASYAQTIIDDGNHLLNAGITLKVNRGISGGFLNAVNLKYNSTSVNNKTAYLLTSGNLKYGYSSNYDNIDTTKSFAANRNVFLQKTYSSASADIGIEYILLADEGMGNNEGYTYETKLGIAVMDIGTSKYRYGAQSRAATAGRAGITDTLLEDKFTGVNSLRNINDSISSIANTISGISGYFSIYQPTRLVINIDQHLQNNFFINAELTVPLIPLLKNKVRYVSDINLLGITPRWELKAVGAYLPILINTKKQVWVGAAFKAGPVLIGTHNLANVFTKSSFQNGGLYLALTVRPGKKYDKQLHYPGKLSKNERRRLDCPVF